LDKIEYVKH